MIFKMAGFIMIALCGGLIGNYYSDKLRKRKESCTETLQIINRISTLIRYRELNVYEIAAELQTWLSYKNTEFVYSLPCEFSCEENFHETWKKAIESDVSLGDNEKNILTSLGNELGTSDTEGQLAILETAKIRLSQLQEIRSEEYTKKGKLYRSVGLLTGVMAGILII